MKSLTNETLEAISSSLSAASLDQSEVFQECISLFASFDRLPEHLKRVLAFKEDSIGEGATHRTFRCLSSGSYTVVESNNGNSLRFIIFKRVGGNARTVFDSEHPEISFEQITWKAITWLKKTISSLDER